MRMKFYPVLLLFFFSFQSDAQTKDQKQITAIQGQRWSPEKAAAWYKEHRWITGANYLPATAINQLEMWQAETFDTATISKEFKWAKNIGFNTMRVFLHSVVWKQDAQGF